MNPNSATTSGQETPPPPTPPVAGPPQQVPVQAHSKRNKITAVLLAIFVGIFGWIYTYQKDKKKFWASLVLELALLVAASVTNLFAVYIIYYLGGLGVYIWVIVDAVRRPEAFFTQYPNYQAANPQAIQPAAATVIPGAQAQVAPAPAPTNPSDEDSYQTLMPTKNKFALKSYYYGCAGIIPVLGLPFTILAITNGRQAMKLYKTSPTPGAKGHAMVGIGLAIFELIILVVFLIIIAAAL